MLECVKYLRSRFTPTEFIFIAILLFRPGIGGNMRNNSMKEKKNQTLFTRNKRCSKFCISFPFSGYKIYLRMSHYEYKASECSVFLFLFSYGVAFMYTLTRYRDHNAIIEIHRTSTDCL